MGRPIQLLQLLRRTGWLLLWGGLLFGVLPAQALELAPEQRQWLATHPEIRVGATEMPPLLMRDFKAGTYSGIAAEFLRLHQERLGVRFRLVYFGSLEEMLEGARNREVDLLFASVPTPGRAQYLAFPAPYAELDNKIIVRRGGLGSGQTLDKLAGHRVSVLAGSALEERLRRDFPNLQLVPARDELTTLTKLAFGEVEAAVSDLSRVTYYVQKEGLGNLAVGGDTGILYRYTFAVRSDWPELVPLLNAAQDDIPRAEREQVLQRWIGVAADGPWRNPRFWAITIGVLGLAALALLVVLAWNRSLRREVSQRTTQLDAKMTQLQASERDLRQSEARFRDLAELSYDWYWEQDEQCRFTMMSGGAFEKGRLPLEQYLGKARWELPVEGVTAEQMAAHRALQEARQPFHDFIYQFRTSDGVVHWYTSSGKPVFDEAGQFRGYRGTGQNISERMRVQQALVDGERRLRGILDSTYSFVGLLDSQGKLLDANRTALDFSGLTKEEVLGQPFWETPWWRDSPEDQAALRQAVERARQGEVASFVATHLSCQGQRRWFDVVVSPVKDEAGRVVYLVPEGRDVTEIRRTQEALRTLVKSTATVYGEAFLGSLVTSLAELFQMKYAFVGELQADGRHVLTRAVWADGSIAPNFTYSLDHTPCDRLLGDGACIFPAGVAERFPDDTLLRQMGVESYMGTTIPGSDQRPLGVLVVLDDKPMQESPGYLSLLDLFALRVGMEMERMAHDRDIHAMNEELERRVAQRTAQLAAANKEMEAFSYSVSHDLRAPLRHIAGFVSLLGEDGGSTFSPESRRYLSIITDAAGRMGDLIDGLLAFSRIGRTELRKAPVDLGKLVDEVVDDLAEEPRAPEVAWQIDALPRVHADRTLLRQVLANLIGNALKYSRGKPRAEIGIQARQGDGRTVLRIEDNGVGFDMKYADKLFGVFQRLHGSSEFEGTGIGLANVKRIVERHGGQVWAEGQTGLGAAFYVSLPDAESIQ